MDTKKVISIMKHIERVVDATKDKKLSTESLEACAENTAAIAEQLGLTPTQALFLSVFVDQCDDESILIKDIANHFECRNINVMCHSDDIDALVEKGYVRCRKARNEQTVYRVPVDVVAALKKDQPYSPPSTKGLTIERFFDEVGAMFEARDDNYMTACELGLALGDLNRDNAHLSFCKKILNRSMDRKDGVLLMLFCHKLVNEDNDALMQTEMEDVFETRREYNRAVRDLRNESHILMETCMIEVKKDEDLLNREVYHLTDRAKKELLSELSLTTKEMPKPRNIMLAKDITEKPLYYNDREQGQIDQLAKLLDDTNFAKVQRRLTKTGMRKGFACLFHGAPGTGKTETAYQIARRTGRDILTVNVSEIKSMWVGESEKNIKGLFDRYRNFCKQSATVPILLFNEADAVLGVRSSGAERAVDKMENSIQNIILQEMETLEGIMIATTNLTANLDPAFERRFLFKIEFDKPGIEAKTAIWRAMIPELNADAATELASTYSFSGGQIENVARKRTVDTIIGGGRRLSLTKIHEYCKAESINKNERRPIGFNRN
jgi:SpoVK/Ycf46/Vps4 family AAA+-type ATPase